MLVFPAHGVLGALDEVIFFAVVVIFVGMMAISWMRSQSNTEGEEAEINPLDSDSPAEENRFELK